MCRDAWGAYDIIWLHDIACVYRRSLNTKVLLTSCICTSSAWQAFPQLSLGFHRCPLKRWDVRNWALRSLNLALLFWTETHTETTEIKVSTVKSTVNSCIFKELRSQKKRGKRRKTRRKIMETESAESESASESERCLSAAIGAQHVLELWLRGIPQNGASM